MSIDWREGRYFFDDGTEINPDLVPKPGLYILCRYDDEPDEEVLCILTRSDQMDEAEFICDMFREKIPFSYYPQ